MKLEDLEHATDIAFAKLVATGVATFILGLLYIVALCRYRGF